MTTGLIPDFKVYTSPIEIMKSVSPLFPGVAAATDSVPTLIMTGSSTEQDLHGDTMLASALQDMCGFPVGKSLWRNHSYNVPDDYFGKALANPVMVATNGVSDLYLVSDVSEMKGARETYSLIMNGAQIGVSGGFMILEYSFDGDEDDWFAPILIHHVQTLEFSTVGIPANQRSWVQNGIKGLFERCVRDDDGDEALKLAPAYKGMFSKDFSDLTKSLHSQGLRKDLEARPIRPTSRDKTSWDPIKKSFIVQRGQRASLVNRDEIGTLMKSLQENTMHPKKKDAEQTVSTEAVQTTDKNDEQTAHTSSEPPQTVIEPVATPANEQDPQKTTTEPVVNDEHKEDTEGTNIDPASPLENTQPEDHKSIIRQYQLQRYNAMGIELGFGPVDDLGVTESTKELQLSEDGFETYLKTFTGLVTKANSTEKAYVDVIHKMCMSVHPGCCPGASGTTMTNSEDSITPSVVKSINDVVAVLKGINTESIKTEITVLTKTAASLKADFEARKREVNAVASDIDKLRNAPLGNPKGFQRTVSNGDEDPVGVATRQDMLSVNGITPDETVWSLKSAWAQTKVETKTLMNDTTLQCRRWPAGVGGSVEKGVRPELTQNQKSLMHFNDWYAYEAGGEAMVPTIDEPKVD